MDRKDQVYRQFVSMLNYELGKSKALKMDNDSIDYCWYYCGECDEEYFFPESENEKCPICGDELDII